MFLLVVHKEVFWEMGKNIQDHDTSSIFPLRKIFLSKPASIRAISMCYDTILYQDFVFYKTFVNEMYPQSLKLTIKFQIIFLWFQIFTLVDVFLELLLHIHGFPKVLLHHEYMFQFIRPYSQNHLQEVFFCAFLYGVII